RPYLHHGQAKTLEDLFTQPAYSFHTDAGNANFSVTLDANDVADLINFLLSIDAEQSEIAPPAGFDGCPWGAPAARPYVRRARLTPARAVARASPGAATPSPWW